MTFPMRLSAAALVVLPVAGTAPPAAARDDLRLIEALQRRDTETARKLLRDGVDVNVRRADGATALAWAAHWDDVETAGLLLAAGADPNAANALGVTPLMLAATNRGGPLAALLLDAGADPRAARANGETALMHAARAGAVGVARALVAHGGCRICPRSGRSRPAHGRPLTLQA